MNANNLHTYRCPKFHVFYLIPMYIRLPQLSEENFLIQLESELKNPVGYRLLDNPRDSRPVSSSEESVKIHNRELPGTAAPSEHFTKIIPFFTHSMESFPEISYFSYEADI